MVWKRGDLENEKVCFEPDLLVGDWLIWLKLAIESRQYLSFIKIIYKATRHRPTENRLVKLLGKGMNNLHICTALHLLANLNKCEYCFQKTICLQLTSKLYTHSMEHSDSESSPSNAVILHHDEIKNKEQKLNGARSRKAEASSKVEMHSSKSNDKVAPTKDAKEKGRREHSLQRPVPIPKDEENVSTTMFTFTLDKQKRSRSVSDIILKQRIRLYFKQDIKNKDTKSDEEAQQGEIIPYKRRKRRYFDKLSFDDTRKPIKCYRCGKTGHISSRCIEEKSQVKCYFCTKSHHCKLCSSAILCNQCGEINHIEYECTEGDKNRCRRCRKKGHNEDTCGVVVFQRGTKQSPLGNFKEFNLAAADPGDRERLRCLNVCQANQGHFLCYSINRDQDRPYEGYLYAQKYDTQEHTSAQPVQLDNY